MLASDFTIQVTPIYNGEINTLNVSEISNNSFSVYGPNGKFYWLVHGKRCDVDVEPLKSTTNVNGSGPYKWIE